MTGPLPGYLAPVTLPASFVYGRVVAARNRRFDRGRGVGSVGLPVISVGNLTLGGTGKTPMVIWLAERLAAAGRRPVIAMRGYGAPRGLAGSSDEAAVYAQRLPDVPVLADPDRLGALRDFLKRAKEIDCVLLDDGFQHRRVRRELDLVLIDASRGTLRDRLFPAGFLREPPASLRRADAVIVTHAQAVDDSMAGEIAGHHTRPPIAWSRHVWSAVVVYAGGGPPAREEVGWLRGKRVLTLLGLGNPGPVFKQLEAVGAVVTANIPARDHEPYDRARMALVRTLSEGVDALVMTAKDWVKARHLIDLPTWPVPIVVPRLEIEVFCGAEELEHLLGRAFSGA